MRFNSCFSVMLFVILLSSISNGLAQNFLWPTDASHYLTSSFAEYRPGHFHAGIDVKTWGKTGYKIFAIEDGYLSRIHVSPFGYGKALYLKLNSGETVVYAHLSRFSETIDKYIKQEQKRAAAYRVTRYLNSTKFPIKKGEVIGYTGSTGIGYPHLHFELRDAGSRPFNPFLSGYKIKDNVKPTIEAISITPLNVDSRVNADVTPLLLKATYLGSGLYEIAEVPIVSGRIGFAVDCQDKADVVQNKFAVYKTAFYINEKLIYSAQYDKFSYDESHFIDFDRDYRLRKRGAGLFQNLYKVKFNKLSFYQPAGDEIGILNCAPESLNTNLEKNLFARGEHNYRIELSDFWGNTTVVSGKFIVAKKFQIAAKIYLNEKGKLLINEIRDQNGLAINKPEIFITANSTSSWKQVKPVLLNSEENFGLPSFYVNDSFNSVHAVKIQTRNEFNEESFPIYFASKNFSKLEDSTTHLILEKDFYDDFVRLELSAQGGLIKAPQISVQQLGLPNKTVPMVQSRLNEFFGIYQFVPNYDGILIIDVQAQDLAGNELNYREQFDLQTITPSNGGEIKSQDGKCHVKFESKKVYQNLFLRLNRHDAVADSDFDAIGYVYEILPQDVLLKGSATIELEYPVGDSLPEKLGIYSGYGSRWGFAGNTIDTKRNIISTNIKNFNQVTLIRDTVPPVIEFRKPFNNSKIKQRKPVLLAAAYDKLSGFTSEKSIVMELDGQMVIAEYDPETKSVEYDCETPLAIGRHILTVKATDNCQNKSIQSRYFYVVGE